MRAEVRGICEDEDSIRARAETEKGWEASQPECNDKGGPVCNFATEWVIVKFE